MSIFAGNLSPHLHKGKGQGQPRGRGGRGAEGRAEKASLEPKSTPSRVSDPREGDLGLLELPCRDALVGRQRWATHAAVKAQTPGGIWQLIINVNAAPTAQGSRLWRQNKVRSVHPGLRASEGDSVYGLCQVGVSLVVEGLLLKSLHLENPEIDSDGQREAWSTVRVPRWCLGLGGAAGLRKGGREGEEGAASAWLFSVTHVQLFRAPLAPQHHICRVGNLLKSGNNT